jgi:uncharacterized protein with GYD domain
MRPPRREDRPSLAITRWEGAAVPLYLTKFSMTPEAWAKLIKEPEDRREAVGRLLEAAGGKLHGYWYAFGDHDGFVLGEAPDNAAMASALVTVAGSGAFSSLSTTVLVTVEEMLDAVGRAQRIAYRPPGG